MPDKRAEGCSERESDQNQTDDDLVMMKGKENVIIISLFRVNRL